MAAFDLEGYLAQGVQRMLLGIGQAAVKNPATAAFMLRFAGYEKQAEARRAQLAKQGEHVPPFLIASITDQCNLHCQGCYARASGGCHDLGDSGPSLLTSDQWRDIFSQAAELGVCFILLAGGEPLVRRDVLEMAAKEPRIIFPVFTNGTMLQEAYLQLFTRHRNLIPVVSIEGGRESTDARRGAGVYDRLQVAMEKMRQRQLLFGASVTVSRKNWRQVLSNDFLQQLQEAGCRAVIYVEYVPVDHVSRALALDEAEREQMALRLQHLRRQTGGMLLVSFPGDEKSSGGCLAAGRGFFHINSRGGAEPCPFSPYSDTSLKEVSLQQALQSPLFVKLQAGGHLQQAHTGGCVLFAQEQQVRELVGQK